MNRRKLERRTALIAKIRDRHNPPYRVKCVDGWSVRAATRAEARELRRVHSLTCVAYVERRTESGTYERIR